MPKRVMLVSSGGGHWIELLRLLPAFKDFSTTFVTVNADYRSQVPDHKFRVVNDATRWNKFALLLMACRLFLIILRERPNVIITTGAAPGYMALRIGKLFRAKTVWIDSIANVDELSLSGKLAGRFVNLWLTQWPHLAQPNGPHYAGAVL
ncbi:MAG TPA: hypothetical protein VG711_11185 [Phycisphaerales bacterium]|nr:hypothetical protein [Phycisphaerales bacterium]